MKTSINQTPRLTALKNNTSLFKTINNPTEQEIEYILENNSSLLNIRLNKDLYLNRNFSQELKIKFIKVLPEIILEIEELNEELVLIAANSYIHILRNKKLIPFISEVSKIDLLRRIPVTVCFFEDIPLDIQEMYLKKGSNYIKGIQNIHPSLFEKVVNKRIYPANLITQLNNTDNVEDIKKYIKINKNIIKKLNLSKGMILKLINFDTNIIFYIEDISNEIIKDILLPQITEEKVDYNLITLCKNDNELMKILLDKFPTIMINNSLSP